MGHVSGGEKAGGLSCVEGRVGEDFGGKLL